MQGCTQQIQLKIVKFYNVKLRGDFHTFSGGNGQEL